MILLLFAGTYLLGYVLHTKPSNDFRRFPEGCEIVCYNDGLYIMPVHTGLQTATIKWLRMQQKIEVHNRNLCMAWFQDNKP